MLLLARARGPHCGRRRATARSAKSRPNGRPGATRRHTQAATSRPQRAKSHRRREHKARAQARRRIPRHARAHTQQDQRAGNMTGTRACMHARRRGAQFAKLHAAHHAHGRAQTRDSQSTAHGSDRMHACARARHAMTSTTSSPESPAAPPTTTTPHSKPSTRPPPHTTSLFPHCRCHPAHPSADACKPGAPVVVITSDD